MLKKKKKEKSHRNDSFLVFPPPNMTHQAFSPPSPDVDMMVHSNRQCASVLKMSFYSCTVPHASGSIQLAAKAEQRLSGFGYGPCLFLWSVCLKAPCCSQVSALVCLC